VAGNKRRYRGNGCKQLGVSLSLYNTSLSTKELLLVYEVERSEYAEYNIIMEAKNLAHMVFESTRDQDLKYICSKEECISCMLPTYSFYLH
jgi:hypothetical protein